MSGFSIDLSKANREQRLSHIAILKENVDRVLRSLKSSVQTVGKASLCSLDDYPSWQNFLIAETQRSDIWFNKAMSDAESIASYVETGQELLDPVVMSAVTNLAMEASEIIPLQRDLRSKTTLLLDNYGKKMGLQVSQESAVVLG
jgi:hypothetical protein